MLLISKYGLDCKPYNEKLEYTTWRECTLRKWLNDRFLNDAFSEEEQSQILATKVVTDWNVDCDNVFLLSIGEAERFFCSDNSRKCPPTAIVEMKGWIL